jgi:hypothetical protein
LLGPVRLSSRPLADDEDQVRRDSVALRASMGPLNQWPREHLILALGSGPSVEPRVYRSSTSAGSPHRTALWPRNAGQSTSIA